MALHLKGVFVWCLLLIILIEEAKPVLAQEQRFSERLRNRVRTLEEKVAKLKGRMKAIEECDACSKIKELNKTVQGIIDPELADCGDPGVPEHGSKTGENYLAGGTVTFTCDAGYRLVGSANLVCLADGNWNNALPKCSKYPSAVAGLEDSVILNNDASYLKALGDFLKPVVHSNSQWKRCWQALVDGWEAKTFHERCDGKGPTVTIVRVGHKYIFGGYTSLSWGLKCGYQYDSAAFLFSLVNKPGWAAVKLDHKSQDKHYSIYSCFSQGPSFGAGHDFSISTLASSNTQSGSNLGSTYSPFSYGSGFAQSFLAGSYRFTPDEVEVFHETT